MPQMNIEIFKVVTGGPFAYVLSRGGLGIKAATGKASFSAALNDARDDAAAQLDPGESIVRATINIQSTS